MKIGTTWFFGLLKMVTEVWKTLSLIPGNVGTAPIQNIGAYGVELKDRFVSCEAMHIETSSELVEFDQM